tara:strand:+ start:276 stop:569 length:294 start_codon:yes stop_codon:yes gene_type:complete
VKTETLATGVVEEVVMEHILPFQELKLVMQAVAAAVVIHHGMEVQQIIPILVVVKMVVLDMEMVVMVLMEKVEEVVVLLPMVLEQILEEVGEMVSVL